MIGYLVHDHPLIHAFQPARRTRREAQAASRIFKMAPKLSDYFQDGETLAVKGTLDRPISGLAIDSRRGRVSVALSNDFRGTTPLLGSAATAVVQGAALTGVRLPASALQFDPEPWVYVVDEAGHVAKRRGALSGDGSVVIDGLAGGESVVRAAAALLSPGQRIEPVQASAGAAALANPATAASSTTRLADANQGAAK